MPEKATVERARRDRRQGKSSSTAAGEFVREEMHHIREGKHGAKSAKQAIAIGLSKARRAGFDPGPEPASAKGAKRKSAKRKASPRRSTAASRRGATSKARARAATKALKRQPRRAASHLALSRQAHSAARRRTKADRSAAARKAARTRAR